MDHTLAGRPGGLDHHEFMSLKRKTAYSPSPPSFYGRGEEEEEEEGETKKARKQGEEEEEKERSRVEAEEETKRSRKARTAFSDAQLREDINKKDQRSWKYINGESII